MTLSSTTTTRRAWLTATLPVLAVAALPLSAGAAAPTPVEVWKDPNCGCCKDWVDHVQANGFAVKVHDTGNNAVRARLGLARPGLVRPGLNKDTGATRAAPQFTTGRAKGGLYVLAHRQHPDLAHVQIAGETHL